MRLIVQLIGLFLLFILISLIVLTIRVRIQHERYTINDWLRKNQSFHRKSMVFLNKLLPWLIQHHYQYWLTDGTLLGCIRHQNVIPWDNDCDIAVLVDQKIDIKTWKSRLTALLINEGYRVRDTDYLQVSYGDVGTDIYLYSVNKENKVVCINNVKDVSFFKDSTELFPLKKALFRDEHFFIPNDPQAYLFRLYGHQCLTKSVVTKLHTHHGISWWTNLLLKMSGFFPHTIRSYASRTDNREKSVKSVKSVIHTLYYTKPNSSSRLFSRPNVELPFLLVKDTFTL